MVVNAGRDLYVDALLTDMSVGYSNLNFIADRLFPVLTVRQQSGLIPRFKKSAWFRSDAQARAPGTKSRGSSWEVDEPLPYMAQRYSFRDEIDDDTRSNADSVYDLEATTVDFVTEKLLLKREVQWASEFFRPGVWGEDLEGAASTHFTQWDDYEAATPLPFLTDAMDDMEGRIGREGNVLVIGKQAWNKLRWHPTLIDAIKYTQTGIVSDAVLSSMLGFDRIEIGRAIMTDTPMGVDEDNVEYTRIWGKHALVMYLTSRPSLKSPAAGYTFIWNRVPNARQYIKRMRNEEREIDIIESNGYWDHVLTSPEAGTFFHNVVG